MRWNCYNLNNRIMGILNFRFGYRTLLFWFRNTLLLLVVLFSACERFDSQIDSMTRGKVAPDIEPFVQFKQDIVPSSSLKLIQDVPATLNGESINVRVSFTERNKLLIFFPKLLTPNTSYKLEIPTQTINDKLQATIMANLLRLKFTTQPNNVKIANLNFYAINHDTTRLKADITLLYPVDKKVLVQAITLKDSDNKDITLNVKSKDNDAFLLESEILTLPKDKDREFSLVFDSTFLGLTDSITTPVTLRKNTEMKVIDILPKQGNDPGIIIRFSSELAKNVNLKDYIQITPKLDFSVAQANNMAYLKGKFNTNTHYQVSVLKGVKADSNAVLQKSVTRDVVIKDLLPSIAFSSTGIFLPQSAKKKIAFKSINVKKVKLSLYKIYPNNLTQFFSTNNLVYGNNQSPYKSYIYDDVQRLGDEVLQQEFTIESEKNTWVQNEIDLSNIKDTKGIFIVQLSFDRNGIDYVFDSPIDSWEVRRFFNYQANIAKHLVFSKIALIAQRGSTKDKENILVTALNVEDSTPLSGVNVEAIDRKNQTIVKARTDAEGNATLNVANKNAQVFYILAESHGDIAMLKLDSQRLSDDGFDVGGEMPSSGVRTFIYTDRGVYRPGDTLHLSAIVRNNNIPLTHPIKLTLTDPRGKITLNQHVLYPSPIQQPQTQAILLTSANTKTSLLDSNHTTEVASSQNTLKSVKPNTDGLYYYAFSIPKNAPTGVWTATFQVGNNTFTHNLSIETIVPDRIKVTINAQKEIDLTKSKNLALSLQGDYLFGAPASDLQYQVSMFVTTKKFVSNKYKNYIFSNYSNLSYNYNDRNNGKLDSKGFMQTQFDISRIINIKQNLEASLVAKVFEKSGRAVKAYKRVLLKKYDSFVGIGVVDDSAIELHKEIRIPVIVVASDDSKLLAGRKLQYRIYRNKYSWWLDYDSRDDFLRSMKTDKYTEIIAEGELVSQDKPILLKHIFEDSGEFLVEVSDSLNGATSQMILYVRDWGAPLDAKKITTLKIQTDKKQYHVGESAKVSFESAAGAKALVTVNKDGKILKRFWINTKDLQTSIEIPLDKNFLPNAYVSVSLLQDYNSTDNDRPLRLYGVVPLNVQDDSNFLKLAIQSPKEVLPGSTLRIQLSNEKKQRATYTLAIVDEGLLSLNSFETPNPYQYFFAKLALALQVFDTYDLIISKTFGKVHDVLRAGGDYGISKFERSRNKDNEHAERFKPVVFFVPPTSTDSKGNATIEFTMPSYIGKVRVMAVASNQDSIGSAQTDIAVTAPVVMLPTLPRSLKNGDSFSLPIEVFPVSPKARSATLSLRAKNDFIRFDKKEVTVHFKDAKPQTLLFNGKVSNAIGVENIEIVLSHKDFQIVDSTQIDIKPINPYMTMTQKYILQPDKTLEITAPTNFIRGSNQGFITLSNMPIFAIDHRLRWLIRYPYGCIEQTTSSVLPQLFIDRLSTAKFINKQQLVYNINAAISRIQGFQVPSGGFSYWQGEGRADSYGSNYAGHFLVLAKQQGYHIPDGLLKQWIQYQIAQVKSNSENSFDRVYSLYLLALAKEPQLGIMNTLYEEYLPKLSVTQKWLLAAAYQMAGMPDVAQKITQNLALIDQDSTYYESSYGSSLRNSAMILQAYYQIYQTIPTKLVDSLLSELESDKWFSTQELGYSLMALAQIKEDSQDSVISGTITTSKIKQNFYQTAPYLSFEFDNEKAEIVSNSKQDLYVSYIWEGIPLEENFPKISKNIILEQQFFDEKGKSIDPRSVVSGTSFYLKLTLSGINNDISIKNVALTQALPSGWEIENLRLNNDTLPAFISQRQLHRITYTDIRDDRIMWFFDYNARSNRKQEFFVKLTAVTPGEYILPPSLAESMYSDRYQATTSGMKVVVKAR
ncbi:alpha-2-macroglobulin family protein [Helicobacter aurati]|uniref:alpha-2-macroglobulin family protein n=1 Tax=Helicobacter aurati TaxID=137778 RepID=UPI000CF025AC|nr:MG2 domain-containing protein [Helicobacter aurati]